MYEVQKIVDSRITKQGKNQYFVKWVGYDSSQNTWEPEKNLTTVRNLINKFNMANAKNNGQSKNLPSKNIRDDDEDAQNISLGSFGEQQDKSSKVSDKVSQKKSDSNNITASKKGKGKKPSKEDPDKQKKIRIVGISIGESAGYIYKVLIDGEIKWVKRAYLVPKYLNELCEFYEENLVLKQ